MDEQTTNKNLAKFACEKCQYITNNKFNYNLHLLTLKHKRTNFGLANLANLANQDPECSSKFSCKCGKKYLHASSLSKHKKSCNQNKTPPEQMVSLDLILKLFKENQGLLMEQNDKIIECLKDGNGKTINTNCNNNNNNKFNINIFLNEQCKDALNIMDFVDQMQLKLTDFESYGEKGYVESVSQIMVRELKGLDVTKRPIHCSDVKREVLYIKDNDAWEKETEEKEKIKKAINIVGQKNFKQIQEWKVKNPEYNNNKSKKHAQYVKIISNSCGSDEEEDEKYFNKIIRNIANNVTLCK
jgi:hypothetical protein